MIEKTRHLLSFSDTPRYNIKAVVQQTQVNVSTLRAWEGRYGVPQPKRTDHGHRLYSQRDVEIIKWLKLATEDGISISQAVIMLQEEPAPVEQRPQPVPRTAPERPSIADAGWPNLRTQLYDALLETNVRQAHILLSTAFSLFPIDAVIHDVILPILGDFSARWADGTGSMAVEQIAVQMIRQRLTSLLQIHVSHAYGPRMIIGATDGEQHDIGALILALLMEQQGWEVVFLGPDLGMTGLADFLVRMAPAVLVLSATMTEHVASIQQVGAMVSGLTHHGIHFAYAGRAFVQNPELCQRMPGTYLGADFRSAVKTALVLASESGLSPAATVSGQNREHVAAKGRRDA